MCLSCGCGEAMDDHGDSRHITLEELREAADAAKIDPEQAAKNIEETVKQAKAS